jgi:hypothetical protein
MVSAVENQEGTSDRRQEQHTIFREDVIVKQASTFFAIANTVLTGLVITIQRGQVDIRTCLVLQPVLVIRSEACMDDEGGEAIQNSSVMRSSGCH